MTLFLVEREWTIALEIEANLQRDSQLRDDSRLVTKCTDLLRSSVVIEKDGIIDIELIDTLNELEEELFRANEVLLIEPLPIVMKFDLQELYKRIESLKSTE